MSVLIGLVAMDYMVTAPNYVMDVHKEERVFLQEPSFKIPEAKPGSERKPTKLKADFCSFRLDKLQEAIPRMIGNWKR